jgi:hypothetical protein
VWRSNSVRHHILVLKRFAPHKMFGQNAPIIST